LTIEPRSPAEYVARQDAHLLGASPESPGCDRTLTLRKRVLILFAAAAVALGAMASPALAATGFKAQSYAGFGAESAGGAITGQKPESKLWYQDGSWWAAMLSPSAGGAHHMYRLTAGGWTDTGIEIDSRPATKEDVLSLDSTLYVLSRSPGGSAGPSQLRRYTYAGGTYTLDPGFPVTVPGAGGETATLARDTTGTLWITYRAGKNIVAAHSLGSDIAWGNPFILPVAGAAGTKTDDISDVIAFSDAQGPAVGVMWSNQIAQSDYFAVHRDGAPDNTWSVETALSGPDMADDHINLKTVEGRVYASVKTSADKLGSSGTLIMLLVRSSIGGWSNYPVATVRDNNTRPIVLLDMSARQLYIFMTIGDSHPRAVVYKQSSLDSIAFSSPVTFMDGSSINNSTSTKQNLSASTGIVVLASDGVNYWWNALGAALPPPGNKPPTASGVVTSTTAGAPVQVALAGGDAETCQLTFTIVSGPSHGSLGTITNQACTPGTPNSDTATLTYTPTAGYTGPDSFTYKTSDGTTDSNTATVTITVTPANTAPTADDASATTSAGTPAQVTLTGHDPETCQLTFTIVSGPSHGSLGTITNQACTPGTPNSDTATLTYTPTAGYTGPDSFTYKTSDGVTDSNTATVTITVSAGSSSDFFPASISFTRGTVTGGDVSSLNADDNVYYQVGSTGVANPEVDWVATVNGVPTSPGSIRVVYSAFSSPPTTQTVWIWRWTTSSWSRLSQGTLGTGETKLTLQPSGNASDYVSSSGVVRVRVRYGGTTSPFSTSSDLLDISVT
jgi:hypothetical protein